MCTSGFRWLGSNFIIMFHALLALASFLALVLCLVLSSFQEPACHDPSSLCLWWLHRVCFMDGLSYAAYSHGGRSREGLQHRKLFRNNMATKTSPQTTNKKTNAPDVSFFLRQHHHKNPPKTIQPKLPTSTYRTQEPILFQSTNCPRRISPL